MTTMYQAANALAGAALSIIPADPVSKKPLLEEWKPFQRVPADTEQIRDWFTANGHAPAGALAIVCGTVSQGITVVDFDTLPDHSTLYDEWAALVEQAMPGLVARLVLVTTPSGGRHAYMRCAVCEGNKVLASSAKRDTWIETRGEGGYALAPMSPGYKTIQGSLMAIPVLTPEERSLLLTAAKALTKFVANHGQHIDTDSLPGAALNAKTGLDDMERWLRDTGWTYVSTRHDGTRVLRRPGKADGISATLGQGGMRTLYVFSSNAAPFEMNTGYSAFAIYTILHHNGDYSASARHLAADGVGGSRQRAKEQRQEARQEPEADAAPVEESWFVPLEKEALASLEPSMLLAPSLVNFVTVAQESTGFPVEFLAVPALAAAGACLGATCRIVITDTWHDNAIIWDGIVGEPGTGKTPSLDLAVSPLHALQRQWHKEWKEELEQHQEKMADWEGCDKKIRGVKPQPPKLQRILTSDTTVEALIPILENNPRGVMLERDELAGWIKGFNQYKQRGGSDREHWLSIWSMKSFTVDRKSESYSAYVHAPFVGVTGGIQPAKLRDLIWGVEDGFSDRLLLFWPESQILDMEEDVPEVPRAVRESYADLLKALYEYAFVVDDDGNEQPTLIYLNREARSEFIRRKNRLATLARDPDLLPALRNAYAKMASHAARVALVLHMAQVVDGVLEDPGKVNLRTMQAAWAIVEVSMSHLRRIYREMGANPHELLLHRLREWIKRRGGTATVRSLMTKKAPGCERASATKALLYELEDRHFGNVTNVKPAQGRDQVVFTLGASE